MAVLETTQFEQLVGEVKQQLLAESQGVGEVEVVSSLSGINSLPALRGTSVVEAPLELLSQPAEEAAERADSAAAQAIQIANDAVEQAQSDIDEAIANAEDTANHPTYVGEDNYVYVWDKANQTYNKTSIYVRGEGFKVSKTYTSIEEMEADTDHGLKEGDFVLINTDDVENPDNAKIYVVNAEGGFTFLVDMSGAIGFTGKTPQFEIGIITTGVGKNDAGATLTENGLDEEGNPKYLLNLRIPSITLDDLSSDEIALLQSPANEMIAQLEETDNQIKSNEDARKEAENLRVEAENERTASETTRQTQEQSRVDAEKVRESNEAERKQNEESRKNAESSRVGNEQLRNTNEESRKASENTRVASEKARNTAEQSRVDSETARSQAEAERKNNENIRQTQEQGRVSAESVRATSEETRISNENARKDNESKREESEETRNTNETARVKAEEDRATEYASLKEDILEATQNANDAASESRNTPIIKNGTWWTFSASANDYVDTGSPATSKSPQIQNGTWWTWDDASGAYVDTGQSVSADYILTKEKIESVFTGNITTHTHDFYVEKEEGKQLSTEDFTTALLEKLNGLENYDDADVNQSITNLDAKIGETKEELQQNINNIVSGNLTSAIESLNEIKAFLTGVEDSQTLLAMIETIEQEIAKKADSATLPTKLSQFENDVPYVTSDQLADGLGLKQDTITDLTTIRSNAEKGATALQKVPSEYITEDELTAKGYSTSTQLSEGLATKQDKNLYFTNLSASYWVEDSTYPDYKYRCDLTCLGVTEDMYAEVVFAMEQFTSIDYAPICETKTDVVSIWADVNDAIVVPTVIVYK